MNSCDISSDFLFELWAKLPEGVIVGMIDDGRWQAATQSSFKPLAFQGDSPRAALIAMMAYFLDKADNAQEHRRSEGRAESGDSDG